MGALEQLRKLTAEQRAILRSRDIKLHRTADDLLALLTPLAELDAAADSARMKAGCLQVFSVVAAAVLLITGFMLDGSGRIAALIACAALVALAIFLRTRVVKPLALADISDNLRTVAIPFLRVLREDVAPGEPVQMHIDLDPLVSKNHRLAEKKTKKTTETNYLDPWFDGQATFADGTRLHWRVVARLRSRTRTKRSASGKTKMKTKNQLRSDAAVKLSFPAKTYRLIANVNGASTEASPDGNAKRISISLKNTQKTLETSTHPFEMLVDLIADGYRSVAARKGA